LRDPWHCPRVPVPTPYPHFRLPIPSSQMGRTGSRLGNVRYVRKRPGQGFQGYGVLGKGKGRGEVESPQGAQSSHCDMNAAGSAWRTCLTTRHTAVAWAQQSVLTLMSRSSTRSWLVRRRTAVGSVLEMLATSGAAITAALLCGTSHCSAMRAGTLLRSVRGSLRSESIPFAITPHDCTASPAEIRLAVWR
jgi:hypothetical protein